MPPASVAPAGGSNQGDGRVRPVPTSRASFVPASVAPAGTELVEGRWGSHPPPLSFWASRPGADVQTGQLLRYRCLIVIVIGADAAYLS